MENSLSRKLFSPYQKVESLLLRLSPHVVSLPALKNTVHQHNRTLSAMTGRDPDEFNYVWNFDACLFKTGFCWIFFRCSERHSWRHWRHRFGSKQNMSQNCVLPDFRRVVLIKTSSKLQTLVNCITDTKVFDSRIP